MLGLIRRNATYANVMATIAVFIALGGASYAAITLPKNSVGSAQLKKNSVTGAKIKKNSVTSLKIKNGSVARADLASAVRAELAKAGTPGPAGAQGSPGPAGSQGLKGERGPSFGDGIQISNLNNFACGVDVVVGSQNVTINERSRIWAHGQGVVRRGGAGTIAYGLWVRLRDAADTTTLAVSTRAWAAADTDTDVMGLTTGGIVLTGDDPDSNTPAFEAPAGTYILQLAVTAGSGTCVGAFPDFGYNQGNAMGYMLVGTQ